MFANKTREVPAFHMLTAFASLCRSCAKLYQQSNAPKSCPMCRQDIQLVSVATGMVLASIRPHPRHPHCGDDIARALCRSFWTYSEAELPCKAGSHLVKHAGQCMSAALYSSE